MPVVDETVVIAHPAGEVFDFLMLAENVGTTLRYRLTAESGLGGAFGRTMEPIVQRALANVVRADFGKLGSLLEQRAA